MPWPLPQSLRKWLTSPGTSHTHAAAATRRLCMETLERRSVLSASTAPSVEIAGQMGISDMPTAPIFGPAHDWHSGYRDGGRSPVGLFDFESPAPVHAYDPAMAEGIPATYGASAERGPADHEQMTVFVLIVQAPPRSNPVALRAENASGSSYPRENALPEPAKSPLAIMAPKEATISFDPKVIPGGSLASKNLSPPLPLAWLASEQASATAAEIGDVHQVEASLASLAYDAALAEVATPAAWRAGTATSGPVQLKEFAAPIAVEKSTVSEAESPERTRSLREVTEEQSQAALAILETISRNDAKGGERTVEPMVDAPPQLGIISKAPAEGGMVLLSNDAEGAAQADGMEMQSRGFLSPVHLEPAVGVFRAFDIASSEAGIAAIGGSSEPTAAAPATKAASKSSTDAASTTGKSSSSSRLLAAAAGVVSFGAAIRILPRRARRRYEIDHDA